jgi:hypothetical protein
MKPQVLICDQQIIRLVHICKHADLPSSTHPRKPLSLDQAEEGAKKAIEWSPSSGLASAYSHFPSYCSQARGWFIFRR